MKRFSLHVLEIGRDNLNVQKIISAFDRNWYKVHAKGVMETTLHFEFWFVSWKWSRLFDIYNLECDTNDGFFWKKDDSLQ